MEMECNTPHKDARCALRLVGFAIHKLVWMDWLWSTENEIFFATLGRMQEFSAEVSMRALSSCFFTEIDALGAFL
ncbi:hypothetical protein INT43_002126 [Umbelopsis isabellina]|uniref:Uncharacterized protein n=1 Tax=Mortierella isabellina TaxID=91625 RepID=A0A8H7PSI0_MORIS|nr:hypothetical protein INT43_002126 [Umbelopsis isabellina]